MHVQSGPAVWHAAGSPSSHNTAQPLRGWPLSIIVAEWRTVTLRLHQLSNATATHHTRIPAHRAVSAASGSSAATGRYTLVQTQNTYRSRRTVPTQLAVNTHPLGPTGTHVRTMHSCSVLFVRCCPSVIAPSHLVQCNGPATRAFPQKPCVLHALRRAPSPQTSTRLPSHRHPLHNKRHPLPHTYTKTFRTKQGA